MRPRSRPIEFDLSSGRDGRRERSGGGIDVAVDVLRAVVVGRHEAAVEILSVPCCNVGDGLAILLVVVVIENETLVLDSIGLECCHHAMS